MSWFNGLVLYILVWWGSLFVVLPFGTRPREAPDDATGWRGAPAEARMGRKLLITTGLACVVWLVAFGVIESGWISFRSGWFAAPGP